MFQNKGKIPIFLQRSAFAIVDIMLEDKVAVLSMHGF